MSTLPDPSTEPTLTARRVAPLLAISERAVYERGEIPLIKVGRSVRVPTAQFLERFGLV